MRAPSKLALATRESKSTRHVCKVPAPLAIRLLDAETLARRGLYPAVAPGGVIVAYMTDDDADPAE